MMWRIFKASPNHAVYLSCSSGICKNLCVLPENLIRLIRFDTSANIRWGGIVESFDNGAGERLGVIDRNEPTPTPILKDFTGACRAVGTKRPATRMPWAWTEWQFGNPSYREADTKNVGSCHPAEWIVLKAYQIDMITDAQIHHLALEFSPLAALRQEPAVFAP